MIVKVKLADKMDVMSKITMFEVNVGKLIVSDKEGASMAYRMDEVLEYEIHSKGVLIDSYTTVNGDGAYSNENLFNEYNEYLDGTLYKA